MPRLDVHLVLTLLAEIQGPDLFAEIGLGRHPMVHSARRPPPSAITSGRQHSARKTPESKRRSCSRGWHTLTGIQSLAILTRGSAPYITYRGGLPCLPPVIQMREWMGNGCSRPLSSRAHHAARKKKGFAAASVNKKGFTVSFSSTKPIQAIRRVFYSTQR